MHYLIIYSETMKEKCSSIIGSSKKVKLISEVNADILFDTFLCIRLQLVRTYNTQVWFGLIPIHKLSILFSFDWLVYNVNFAYI